MLTPLLIAHARGARLGFLGYPRAGVPLTLLALAWGIGALILVAR